MDIQNLQAFISVSETGSFSKAAERLFITQPAVSKRITALETALGARLFDRIGKKVQLTEAGEALLPGARHIISELEESRRIISNLSGNIGGALRIGTSHHIGLHRLPPVLRAFTTDFPEVDLDIHFMDSEEACDAVLRGDLELAIATLPGKPPERLATHIIWHDPLDFVVANQHPLAAQASISIDDLMAHPAILPSQSTFTRSLLEKELGLDPHHLNIALETNYLETIKMMVSIGLGWSVLPISMLSPDIQSLHLPGFDVERLLGVAYHQQRTLSNAARVFLEKLFEQQD
jgi:DNA-binding transcriptional LysR family regulator